MFDISYKFDFGDIIKKYSKYSVFLEPPVSKFHIQMRLPISIDYKVNYVRALQILKRQIADQMRTTYLDINSLGADEELIRFLKEAALGQLVQSVPNPLDLFSVVHRAHLYEWKLSKDLPYILTLKDTGMKVDVSSAISERGDVLRKPLLSRLEKCIRETYQFDEGFDVFTDEQIQSLRTDARKWAINNIIEQVEFVEFVKGSSWLNKEIIVKVKHGDQTWQKEMKIPYNYNSIAYGEIISHALNNDNYKLSVTMEREMKEQLKSLMVKLIQQEKEIEKTIESGKYERRWFVCRIKGMEKQISVEADAYGFNVPKYLERIYTTYADFIGVKADGSLFTSDQKERIERYVVDLWLKSIDHLLHSIKVESITYNTNQDMLESGEVKFVFDGNWLDSGLVINFYGKKGFDTYSIAMELDKQLARRCGVENHLNILDENRHENIRKTVEETIVNTINMSPGVIKSTNKVFEQKALIKEWASRRKLNYIDLAMVLANQYDDYTKESELKDTIALHTCQFIFNASGWAFDFLIGYVSKALNIFRKAGKKAKFVFTDTAKGSASRALKELGITTDLRTMDYGIAQISGKTIVKAYHRADKQGKKDLDALWSNDKIVSGIIQELTSVLIEFSKKNPGVLSFAGLIDPPYEVGLLVEVSKDELSLDEAFDIIGQENERAKALLDEEIAIAYLAQIMANNAEGISNNPSSLERAKLFISLVEKENGNKSWLDDALDVIDLNDEQKQLRIKIFEALLQ